MITKNYPLAKSLSEIPRFRPSALPQLEMGVASDQRRTCLTTETRKGGNAEFRTESNKYLLAGFGVAMGLLQACGQAPAPGATSLAGKEGEFTDMQISGEDAVKFASLLQNCGAGVDVATQSTKADGLRCEVATAPQTGQSCVITSGSSQQTVTGARAARLLGLMVKYRIFHRAGMQGGGKAEVKGISCRGEGTTKCLFSVKGAVPV